MFVLVGLEALRQIHYLISEHWAGYHRFWTHTVFGGFERLTHRRLSDWTRFRLRRLLTWVLWITVVAVVIGKVIHTSPVLALLRAPELLWHALPFVLQLMVILLVVVGQFAAIFWFLSRGGVDVYYPDDIKTRFADVWGQDHVLERVKENILYLEDPERIESRGGYVPGGILLWGPPGTGKTLMAEAVAGETGRPYVFVDPGAFINMFMGVGILKVKSLFRKLRRLALRYGGVIVFFDEADSLGRRGALAQGGPNFPRRRGRPRPQTAGCHGFSYLSRDVQWRLAQRAMHSRAGEEPDARRNKQIMGGMMGGGGGGMGTLRGPAHRAVRAEKAARFHQPARAAAVRHAPQAAAEVPDPGDDGDQPARGAGRGAAAPGPDRPHLQGGLPVQGRPGPHLRGLLRQGAPRADPGADGQARGDHPVRDRRHHQGPGQRGADHGHP